MSLALVLLALSGGPPATEPTAVVKVDSARHEVVITSGPFDLPNMPPMEDHAMMDLGASHDTPVQRFEWPVEGWFRGFRLEVRDGNGKPLPRHIMHHMIMINYDRRQLLYQAAERLMGAGTETDDARIPSSIGVPLAPGTNLGMYVAWHNDTGKDLKGVYLTTVLEYLPKNQNPRPLDVLPLYMDVNLNIGSTNTFDVPPGKSAKSYEFTVPISGRLIGMSGHLHDYGSMVVLSDAESGKELARVSAVRDKAGKIVKMGRKLPGVRGEGIRLKAGHRYRVTGYYDSPVAETLKNGAMASMVGLFAPDDLAQWPRIDEANPVFQRDLTSLQGRGKGAGMEGMDHGGHQHHD